MVLWHWDPEHLFCILTIEVVSHLEQLALMHDHDFDLLSAIAMHLIAAEASATPYFACPRISRNTHECFRTERPLVRSAIGKSFVVGTMCSGSSCQFCAFRCELIRGQSLNKSEMTHARQDIIRVVLCDCCLFRLCAIVRTVCVCHCLGGWTYQTRVCQCSLTNLPRDVCSPC